MAVVQSYTYRSLERYTHTLRQSLDCQTASFIEYDRFRFLTALRSNSAISRYLRQWPHSRGLCSTWPRLLPRRKPLGLQASVAISPDFSSKSPILKYKTGWKRLCPPFRRHFFANFEEIAHLQFVTILMIFSQAIRILFASNFNSGEDQVADAFLKSPSLPRQHFLEIDPYTHFRLIWHISNLLPALQTRRRVGSTMGRQHLQTFNISSLSLIT